MSFYAVERADQEQVEGTVKEQRMQMDLAYPKGPRTRGNIVAETLLRKHCFLAVQTGKHLLKKQNVSEKTSETFFVSQKQKTFPQQMFPVRANGETFRE